MKNMKIWFQTGSPVEQDFVEQDPKWASQAAFLRQYIPKLGSPGTEVHLKGVALIGPNVGQFKYFQYLHTFQMIENAICAEREGYDCFIFGAMSDLGFYEIREVVDIPLAFINQASIYVSCLIARKFALVAPSPILLRWEEEIVKRYGFGERMAPGVHMGETDDFRLAKSWDNPELTIRLFTEASRKAIAEGAGILVPGIGWLNSFLVDRGVADVDGIPVLNTFAAVVKTAELLVNLRRVGITVNKRAVGEAPTKDELARVRKSYGDLISGFIKNF